MERPLIMILHSIFLAFMLYIILIYIFNQNYIIAETRSVFWGGVMLIYMIMFGHGPPTSINKMLF